jgi:NhaP-type Na+/H+ or K+/H+ antiporter
LETAHPAFTVVLALAAGVLAQTVARHLRIPGIVLLLGVGAALGPDGLGWVDPTGLGHGLLTIVELSVAVILFEGGLNLELSRLRRAQTAIQRLVLLGAVLTAAGAALVVRVFLGWDWTVALVFGGLVSVTGPTVVGPLVRQLRLRPRVATVLEAEGVLIDPVGALLAVLLLSVALAPSTDTVAEGLGSMAGRVGLGAVAGAVGGFLLARLLRVHDAVPEGLENIVVLASVLFMFQGCNELQNQSGLMAVTVAGVVVGNMRSPVDRDLREFKDQLTILLIGLLFVLLAAAVRLEDVVALGVPGLAVVIALIMVVRPLTTWACTAGSDLSWRERALVGWLAPRGIVAAAVASVAAVEMDEAGVAGGRDLLSLVFLTIAATVVLAGFTAAPVARWLGQRLPGRDTVAILGAGGLGLLLGRALREGGVPVTFLDSNPNHCRQAEEEGFTVVYGNALQERTLLRARMENVGVVAGATQNQMLNGVFVSRTRDRFSVPTGYVATSRPESGLAPELLQEQEVEVLFDGPHEVERWDVRMRHGGVDVDSWVFVGAPEPEEGEAEAAAGTTGGQRGSDRFVILTLRRGTKTGTMHAGLVVAPGDVAAIAVYAPEAERAEEELRDLGWKREEAASEPDAA